MSNDEILAVGYSPADGRTAFPIVASSSPSIVILRAEFGDLENIAADADVAMARGADGTVVVVGDASAIDALDASGRLFVDAWRSRAPEKLGRVGDGLAWDAPGFEPPDR